MTTRWRLNNMNELDQLAIDQENEAIQDAVEYDEVSRVIGEITKLSPRPLDIFNLMKGGNNV